MSRAIVVVLVTLVFGLAMAAVAADLPQFGSEAVPSRTPTVERYTVNAPRDTGAVNSVTAIVFDYRAYDTLGEATVLFTAAMAAAAALAGSCGPAWGRGPGKECGECGPDRGQP